MTAQVKKKQVLLVDGRHLMRDLLGASLAGSNGFEVSAQADGRDSALAYLAKHKADVVLFGIGGLDEGVDDFVHAVLMARPSAAVMAIVASDSDPKLFDALDAGAIAFATYDMSLRELCRSLQAAAVHETVLPAEFARRVLGRMNASKRAPSRRDDVPRLTAREYEILGLLMQGQSNAEIAQTLGVSINTVKNHLYSIYRKLGVTSRGQAFAAASEMGLVRS